MTTQIIVMDRNRGVAEQPADPPGAAGIPAPSPKARRWSQVPGTWFAAMGLILLEGKLFPLSFPTERLVAAGILAGLVVTINLLKREGSRPVLMTGLAVASALLVSRAPTMPLALVGYALGLLIVAACDTRRRFLPIGLGEAAVAIVAIRFAADLWPSSRGIGVAVTSLAGRYLAAATGGTFLLSPTALGGPAVLLATLFLLARWNFAGSPARLVTAAALPFGWFAMLAALTPKVESGPSAAFHATALHGLCWLAVAALVDAMIPERPGPSGRSIGRAWPIFAGLAGLSAGSVLVGDAFLGGPADRRILVHNRGGLDWDRPVFGRFGAFSGGMFGLWPVYSRAEGYEFAVLDADRITAEDLSRAQIFVLINSPKVWDDEERHSESSSERKNGNGHPGALLGRTPSSTAAQK